MKKLVMPVGCLLLALLTTACDSTQGLFGRRSSDSANERNRSANRNDDNQEDRSGSGREGRYAEAGDDLRERSRETREEVRERAQDVKEDVRAKSQDIKQDAQRVAGELKEDATNNRMFGNGPDQDTPEENAFEERVRQRLGLSSGQSGRQEESSRYDDRRDAGNDHRMANDRYAENQRNDNRSYDNRSMDNRSMDNRSTDNRSLDNRSTENRSMDNRSSDNRMGNAAGRENRSMNPNDRMEGDSYRSNRTSDDRMASDPSGMNRAEGSYRSDGSNGEGRNNRSNLDADRRQLTDRIGELMDNLDRQIDQLNRNTSPTGRTQRQTTVRELEKYRNDLMKAYYQVQRGSEQNWTQTRRQADRLVYDVEEKLEKMAPASNR